MPHVFKMLIILVLYFAANCLFTDAYKSNEQIVAPPVEEVPADGVPAKPYNPDNPAPCSYPPHNGGGPSWHIECGKNEALDKCPSYCPSDFCPTGDGQNAYCPSPKPCPRPACKCAFNHRRAQNGTCIPTKDCPSFKCTKPNEEYVACPPYCPTDDCSQATPTGKCPLIGRIGIVLECRPACRCKKGFWRNNGICVPYKECPGKLTCGPNEVVVTCPGNCTTDYCPNSSSDLIENCTKPCPCPPPACKCADNYRRDKSGTCIPKEKCPETLTCPPGEVIDNCPAICNTDYCPTNENDVRSCYTPSPCLKPACRCPRNHLRAQNGTCIRADTCPPIKCTRPHETFYSCPPLCPSDDCKQATWSGECPISEYRGIEVECRPGCRCEKSYWRQNGTCVPFGQCGLDCSGPHEYYACGGGCDNVCSKLLEQSQGNCPIRNIRCNDECYCEKGYARDARRVCIPISECPSLCTLPNEEYTDCKKKCPPDTCNAPTIRCIPDTEPCKPGCVCKPNFLRKKEGGPCVPQCECQELRNTDLCKNTTFPLCTLPNEEHTRCKINCPSDLCSSVISSCIPDETPCEPGCVCKPKFLRKKEGGPCVPQCECQELRNTDLCKNTTMTPVCNLPNEEYTDCKKRCPSDLCTSVLEKCVDNSPCSPGCVCKSGYRRKNQGEECVPICQCPELRNAPDFNETACYENIQLS